MQTSALRQALLARLGRFPERVPLAATMGPPTDEADYTRTLVTYMVEPDERTPAWLLSPKGRAPRGGWPALLAIHQHAGQYDLGKSEPASIAGDPMYSYGRDLCRRGYVVLCPDLLCFEERRPPKEVPQGRNVLDDAGYERFEFTKRILMGSCLQTKYLHDLSCALDLLTSLPDVNRSRIGVIGHSLGGQESLWLAWYDARVSAAVSSCGFGLLRTLVRDRINHNFAAYVPAILEVCDMDALVADLAPRAFLLTAGEMDPLFPVDGVRSVVEHAQRVYIQKGVPERFQAILFPAGHSFPDEIKVQAYAFLDRWLQLG
jgi:dienelactone hydrolase